MEGKDRKSARDSRKKKGRHAEREGREEEKAFRQA